MTNLKTLINIIEQDGNKTLKELLLKYLQIKEQIPEKTEQISNQEISTQKIPSKLLISKIIFLKKKSTNEHDQRRYQIKNLDEIRSRKNLLGISYKEMTKELELKSDDRRIANIFNKVVYPYMHEINGICKALRINPTFNIE